MHLFLREIKMQIYMHICIYKNIVVLAIKSVVAFNFKENCYNHISVNHLIKINLKAF